MKKAETVQPLWSRFLLSTGTNAPSPPRCAPGLFGPGSCYQPGPMPPSSVPVRGPTGTSFSPELLVPVGEPGLKALTNRDNRGGLSTSDACSSSSYISSPCVGCNILSVYPLRSIVIFFQQ